MGAKTHAAFTFTMNTLENRMRCKKLYMWTFTFKEVETVEVAVEKWSNFLNHPKRGLMCSFPSMSAIRVFEMHKGGENGYSHGLHIHLVTDAWLPVEIIRMKWHKLASEGGRINVLEINKGGGHYIGKYLRKQRDPCLKGYRLWQALGMCQRNTRNVDVVIDCAFTDAYKFLSAAISGFKTLSYGTRAVICRRFMYGESIANAMKACQIEADHWQQVKEEAAYFASLRDPWNEMEEDGE